MASDPILRRLSRFVLRHLVPRCALRRTLRMARAASRAIRAAGILFPLAALLGWGNAWMQGGGGIARNFPVILDPARAALAFLVAAWLWPEAFPSPRRPALYALLLPTLYLGLLVSLKIVAEGSGPPLVRFGEAPRVDVMWRDPRFLAAVWATQVVLLFVLGRSERP